MFWLMKIFWRECVTGGIGFCLCLGLSMKGEKPGLDNASDAELH